METTQNLVEYLEKSINKENLKNAIVKIVLENVENKLLLEFDEKLFLSFFRECFYFEYKKIKFIENKQQFGNIEETSNTIVDNFEKFFENYPFSDTMEDKENLKNELKKYLLN